MPNTVLFAGKDCPDEFINILADKDYRIAVAASGQTSISNTEKTVALKWNRSSPVSARSIIVEIEKTFDTIGTAILCFDAPFFATQFVECDVENISQAIDCLVAGFQYLAVEIFARFAQKKNNGKLIFLAKKHQSMYDVKKQQKNADFVPANPIVAAAQAAFCAFAENFAVFAEKAEFGTVVLASYVPPKDTAATDGEIATLLLEHLKSLDETATTKRNAKNINDWVKLGVKKSGFLSRFM